MKLHRTETLFICRHAACTPVTPPAHLYYYCADGACRRRAAHAQFGGWEKPSRYWRGTLKFINCETTLKASDSAVQSE